MTTTTVTHCLRCGENLLPFHRKTGGTVLYPVLEYVGLGDRGLNLFCSQRCSAKAGEK